MRTSIYLSTSQKFILSENHSLYSFHEKQSDTNTLGKSITRGYGVFTEGGSDVMVKSDHNMCFISTTTEKTLCES